MSGKDFAGRVAVITGAGGGLGREYALLLARHGARIVVNDIGERRCDDGSIVTSAEATAEEIRAIGGEAVAHRGDVSVEKEARDLIDVAISSFGQVDIAISNAGSMRFVPFESMTRADLQQMFDVHVGGAFNVVSAAWSHMMAQRHGRIILTSSNAIFGLPELAHYSTAKAAILGLMRSLMIEGREHGITVNAVMPNAVTNMATSAYQERGLDPGVLDPATLPAHLNAHAVAWLVHPDCDLSGQVVHTGNGHVARMLMGVTRGIRSGELSWSMIRDRWDEIVSIDNWTEAGDTADILHLLSLDDIGIAHA